MKKTTRILPLMLVAFGVLFITCMESCKREYLTNSTTATVNMLTYMKQNPDKFSSFIKIVEKAGYASFLDAYGAYTLFAPTNEGVSAYLKKINKASVNDIDETTAKNLVRIAIVQDTIATNLFTDGKLRTPTMFDQYLITGAANTDGVTSIRVNKQANLLQGNIRLGNGIIHTIDNVLIPSTLTLAQLIEQDPKYSIFSEALKATGFYDTLNVVPANNTNLSRKFLTVIAQTNDVFKAAGINDFNALKQKYSKTGDVKNKLDSVYLFIAYRILPELAYVPDFAVAPSHPTLAPLEVTTSEKSGADILLNNIVFNGVLEPGAPIDRALSDNSALNGVLHSAKVNYRIKVRQPTAVYFDLGDQPEIRRSPGVYRAGKDKATSYINGQLADVSWIYQGSAGETFVYRTTNGVRASTDYYFGGDYIEPGVRFKLSNNSMSSITFKTPLIVRGRYKVWLDYKRNAVNAPFFVSVDGQTLPNLVNTNDAIKDTDSDALLESRGYKRYSDSPLDPAANSGANGHVGRLCGVVNITTTDRHILNMTINVNAGAAPIQWDVVEFRPIEMNQVYPKLGRDGTLKN